MVDRFLGLLTAAVEDPATPVADLPLLSDAERAQVLEWSGTSTSDAPLFVTRFEEQVTQTPHAVAVDLGGG